MKVLVDTDMLSEVERAKNAQILARARAYEEQHGAMSISVLTVYEVMHGWHQVNRADRGEAFLKWLKGADLVKFDFDCARLAGMIGGALDRTGQRIGFVDVGLAATAIQMGYVLVTGNVEHFERVRAAGFDLEIQNWREPEPEP
jgi:predicted nucleic acid-binding protein